VHYEDIAFELDQGIAVITLGAKEGLYRYTMTVANRFDSNMLRANAWHHRSDALSSLIVAAGIGGSLLGLGYLDSVAALIVALILLFANPLVDRALTG